MFGLIFIYFVGKAFYDLAGQYNKSQWGFAILGVVSYYGGLFGGGFILAIVIELTVGGVEEMNEYLLGFFAILLGLLTCWLTYRLLKKNWSKPPEVVRNTLDADLMSHFDKGERYNKDERQ